MIKVEKLNRIIDLHAHTDYSDGALSPQQLVDKAKESGLSALGIADHDTVSGLPEGIAAGEKEGVEVVPAVEITAYPNEEKEIHILGYFIDWKNKRFQEVLEGFQKEREERARKLVNNLNNTGYLINFGDLRALSRGTITKPHIAWIVINDLENKKKLEEDFGKFPTTGEFIGKYLVVGSPIYEKRGGAVKPKEAIDLIHKHAGLVILAHPCWDLTEEIEGKIIFDDKFLEDLIKDGLDGIEVFTHRDSEEDTKTCVDHYQKIAIEKNLAVSGGSDYHGFGSAGKELGFANFYLKVPYSVLEDLRSKL